MPGSIAVTPGSGATVGAGSDGTNQIPATILCGASASGTLYATCVNQAIVNASGQLLTLDTQSGTWTVGISGTVTVTGTVNLGTIGVAATAANQEVTAAGTTATSAQGVQGVTGGVPLTIAGTVSAAFSGFTPGTTDITPFAVSSSAVTTVSLPSGTATLIITSPNTASVIPHCTLGASATTSDQPIQPGQSWAWNASSATQFSCITSSGSVTLSASVGSGNLEATSGNGAANGLVNNTAPIIAMLMGGSDGTDIRAFSTDSTGRLNTNIAPSAGAVFTTNQTEQAGQTLAPLTAPGTPQTTGLVPTVNLAGSSLTASIGGFTPNGNTLASPATIGSTASSAASLPTGATVLFSNTGSNVLEVRIGSTGVVATANDIPIQPGSGCAVVVGANTSFSAISASGSTLNAQGGSGLGNCPSGGGGGGSSSGAASDANLTTTGTITTANVFGTGLSNVGQGVLTGTATTGSQITSTGVAGFNTVYVECSGLGTAGNSWFEFDKTAGGGGANQWKRKAALRVPTSRGPSTPPRRRAWPSQRICLVRQRQTASSGPA